MEHQSNLLIGSYLRTEVTEVIMKITCSLRSLHLARLHQRLSHSYTQNSDSGTFEN